jgi:hypothetical protein
MTATATASAPAAAASWARSGESMPPTATRLAVPCGQARAASLNRVTPDFDGVSQIGPSWMSAGAEVAQRGQDKYLHYSRGVTVEEMRAASIALRHWSLPDLSLDRKVGPQ